MTNACFITLIAYYASNRTVQRHIFKLLCATCAIYLEATSVNGHYDLVIDGLKKSGYDVSAGTNHQVIEITDSPCKFVGSQK